MAILMNVAIVGGTGDLGKYLTAALVNSKDLKVTLVSRSKIVSDVPAGVTTAIVDYTDPETLISAFKGQDLLNVAIAAGVPRFIPSEFGSNNRNPSVRKMAFFQVKVIVDEAVKKAADEGKITHTSIVGGGFVQWMLSDEHVMPVKERKFFIHGDGNVPFRMTTMEAYGDALVGVLHHLEETKNRMVSIGSITVTQNHVLKLANEVVPGGIKVIHVDTNEEFLKAQGRLHKGEFDMDIVSAHVLMAVFTEGYGGAIENVDNELVGVKTLTDEDLKQIIKSLA